MDGVGALCFFKQRTAYEIRLSLVGSEMCIRDSMRVYHLIKSRMKKTPFKY